MSDVAETWWDAGGIFACPDTDSFSARCQNREGHSPLAIHTAAFVHVLVLLAAGFALCFGESINLTRLGPFPAALGRALRSAWRSVFLVRCLPW
jgi:hypothetical protein